VNEDEEKVKKASVAPGNQIHFVTAKLRRAELIIERKTESKQRMADLGEELRETLCAGLCASET